MAGPAALAALQEIARSPARRVGDSGGRLLPVVSALAAVLPEAGLRRGTTVAVTGSASLLLTVLCGPSQAGAWCAVVGFAQLGLLAAAEAGVELERLVLVPAAGARWPAVAAALLDAMDVVVVRPPDRSRPADGRRLMARARERGAVLVAVGGWEGADLRVVAVERRWDGVGPGHGRVRTGNLLVEVSGRGAARRSRRVWLSGTGASPASAPDAASVRVLPVGVA
ncbi:conserved hypothetical protein [Frankia canadensis]|uniref:Protein RecA n=1 Tax=Frankia canadensis TaxID=1836972 RepID=A0A2I2KMS4_9ACTN|nr:hypothetical protein [Frankia canadensis]SNQ46964.1 conserved hypothetical protein [Frankia canadensis]SOU54254.1 conserved hypothetical protein [Frankia canadensis]